MKLRIKGNSIRLRLGRSEVERIAALEAVDESTTFDPVGLQRLAYRLVATSEVANVTATFEAGTLLVQIPTDLALAWTATDRIGIEASQPASDGKLLRILIEKDLECLDAPVDESQADAYPRDSHGSACGSNQT